MTRNIQLFIDMDGVLTDFDTSYKKLTGKTPKEQEDKLKQTYSDSYTVQKKFWERIDEAGSNFWANFNFTKNGLKLWKELSIYNPTILTAPSQHPSSTIGKIEFLKKNSKELWGRDLDEVELLRKVIFSPSNEKQDYGHNPFHILIDDRYKTVLQWNLTGGTGIFHPTNMEDITLLLEYVHTTVEKLQTLKTEKLF